MRATGLYINLGSNMDRRSFISTLGLAVAGFSILPSAGRVWKAVAKPHFQVNPEWVTAEYRIYWLAGHFPEGAWETRREPNPDYESAPFEAWVIDQNGARKECFKPKLERIS